MVLRKLNFKRCQREIEKQKMISLVKSTANLNQDLGFLVHYFPVPNVVFLSSFLYIHINFTHDERLPFVFRSKIEVTKRFLCYANKLKRFRC